MIGARTYGPGVFIVWFGSRLLKRLLTNFEDLSHRVLV
jgi:hypothetical protein